MSQALIDALQAPTCYSHTTTGFTVRETHISWVILTGDYAYKIKKPVNLGFLDYSTLAQRRHFCEVEVSRNQHFNNQTYLEVVPISGSPEAPLVDDDSAPFEYAVKMRQFDDRNLLCQLQQRGELTTTHIEALVRQLAHAHQHAEKAPAESDAGSLEAIKAPVQNNFTQIAPLLEDEQDKQQLKLLETWAHDTADSLAERLNQRRAQGMICACHGDLHLSNTAATADQVMLFDCIEFNPSLYWIDPISDLAFLLMDLESRELHTLANVALNLYLELTGDYNGLALLPYYKSYRAMVRAKVSLLRLKEEANPLDAEDRASILRQYRTYSALAEHYIDFHMPYLLVTHGVSGSGKSTLTRYVVEALGAIRIRSDVERKRLYGFAPNDASQSPLDSGIYTQEATAQTYDRLASLGTDCLKCAVPVIFDATGLKRSQRDQLRAVGEGLGVPVVIINMAASEATLRRRIVKRQTLGDQVAEADLTILERQLAAREPLEEDELQSTVHVDTDAPGASQTLVQLLKDHLHLEER